MENETPKTMNIHDKRGGGICRLLWRFANRNRPRVSHPDHKR